MGEEPGKEEGSLGQRSMQQPGERGEEGARRERPGGEVLGTQEVKGGAVREPGACGPQEPRFENYICRPWQGTSTVPAT